MSIKARLANAEKQVEKCRDREKYYPNCVIDQIENDIVERLTRELGPNPSFGDLCQAYDERPLDKMDGYTKERLARVAARMGCEMRDAKR